MDEAGRDFTARRRDLVPGLPSRRRASTIPRLAPGCKPMSSRMSAPADSGSRRERLPSALAPAGARACRKCVELRLRLTANLRRETGILQDLPREPRLPLQIDRDVREPAPCARARRDRQATAFPIHPASSEPLQSLPPESFDRRQQAASCAFRVSAEGAGGGCGCWAGEGAASCGVACGSAVLATCWRTSGI